VSLVRDVWILLLHVSNDSVLFKFTSNFRRRICILFLYVRLAKSCKDNLVDPYNTLVWSIRRWKGANYISLLTRITATITWSELIRCCLADYPKSPFFACSTVIKWRQSSFEQRVAKVVFLSQFLNVDRRAGSSNLFAGSLKRIAECINSSTQIAWSYNRLFVYRLIAIKPVVSTWMVEAYCSVRY